MSAVFFLFGRAKNLIRKTHPLVCHDRPKSGCAHDRPKSGRRRAHDRPKSGCAHDRPKSGRGHAHDRPKSGAQACQTCESRVFRSSGSCCVVAPFCARSLFSRSLFCGAHSRDKLEDHLTIWAKSRVPGSIRKAMVDRNFLDIDSIKGLA